MTPIAYNEAAARQDPAVRLSSAFIAAASEVRPLLIGQYPHWRDIPRIMTHGEAFDSRMAAMSAGMKARVDFKKVFAKFAKARLAAFEPAYANSELFRYLKRVEEKLSLAVEWHHKSGIGIGKLLELNIGARWDDKAAVMRYSVPMFYGFAESADWAYNAKEDLEACLDAGADFVDLLLPPLGDMLARNMAMPEIPGGAGAITACEALEIAKRKIAGVSNLALQFAGAEIRRTTGHWGQLIGADGRIRAHAEWVMRFVAESGDGVIVQAPYMGAPLVFQFPKSISRFEPVVEVFVDSSEALRNVTVDSRFPENAVVTALTLGYQRPYMPGACWRVDFVVSNTTSRGLAWVGAADGNVVYYGR
jgi:hypothetical protein